MQPSSPENRPRAPGALGDLQDFLNSGHLDAAARLSPEAVEVIARRSAAGESDAALAREFDLTQGFVAALRRGSPVFEELRPASAAGDWLVRRGFLDPGDTISDADLPKLLGLRERLRELAAANNGHPISPEALRGLNEAAAGAPLVVAFEANAGPSLAPAAGGAGAAIGRILGLVFAAMRDGSWERLKRCPGTGCPFTFYDGSRNRTGTWCSMSVCGNRAKVRKYQQRKRVSHPG